MYLLNKDTQDVFELKNEDVNNETSDNDDISQDSSEDYSKKLKKDEDEEEEEEEEDLDEEEDEEQDSEAIDDVTNPNLITNNKNAIKNKIKENKGGCDMDFENHETPEHKPDGAESQKERRITKCMEETGKSREVCTQEVRKKMHKEGAEVVNPEDMDEKKTKKSKEEEEKEDTVEVCSKEYDFLKEQAEELKALKAEKEKVDNTLESFKKDFLAFKEKVDKKEAKEKEVKRQDAIKRISHDFDVPEDKLSEKTMEQLLEHEEILELALKRDTENEEEETFGTEEDFKEIGDKIYNRYNLEV